MAQKARPTEEKASKPQTPTGESHHLHHHSLQPTRFGSDAPAVPAMWHLQRTLGNRAVSQQLAQASSTVMRQVDYPTTKKYIDDRVYQAGALVAWNLNGPGVSQNIRDTVNELVTNANLQATTTFFHGGEQGLIPNMPAWAGRAISPCIEFNVAKKSGVDRVVYDVRDGSVYLNAHYDGFIRVAGLSAAAVNHLEQIAATNIAYMFPPYNNPGLTANVLVQNYHTYRINNPD
jgi:hypothetical protein